LVEGGLIHDGIMCMQF